MSNASFNLSVNHREQAADVTLTITVNKEDLDKIMAGVEKSIQRIIKDLQTDKS